nr:MAG TPA: hypothetical protein [Caudoviricetes sp.]
MLSWNGDIHEFYFDNYTIHIQKKLGTKKF